MGWPNFIGELKFELHQCKFELSAINYLKSELTYHNYTLTFNGEKMWTTLEFDCRKYEFRFFIMWKFDDKGNENMPDKFNQDYIKRIVKLWKGNLIRIITRTDELAFEGSKMRLGLIEDQLRMPYDQNHETDFKELEKLDKEISKITGRGQTIYGQEHIKYLCKTIKGKTGEDVIDSVKNYMIKYDLHLGYLMEAEKINKEKNK